MSGAHTKSCAFYCKVLILLQNLRPSLGTEFALEYRQERDFSDEESDDDVLERNDDEVCLCKHRFCTFVCDHPKGCIIQKGVSGIHLPHSWFSIFLSDDRVL
jgi:hypothetical protein